MWMRVRFAAIPMEVVAVLVMLVVTVQVLVLRGFVCMFVFVMFADV